MSWCQDTVLLLPASLMNNSTDQANKSGPNIASIISRISGLRVISASSGKTADNQVAVIGAPESDSNSINADPTGADPNKGNTKDVGGPMVHPESVVARNFNEALVNSPVDLIAIDFKIWGDPYYIADSGMGNYSAAEATFNMNSDGAMEYQNGEVDIKMNFRTPIDYAGAYMEFPGGGYAPVGQFSGVYQVLFVNNSFSQGEFTQTLQTIRRPKQDTDTKQTAGNQTGATTKGDSEKQIEKTETNSEGGKAENAYANDANASAPPPPKNSGASSKIEGTSARRLPDGRIVGGL